MWKTEEYFSDWGSDWALSVGKQIREDRKNVGLTIRELAEEIGISPTHLNRIENGERPLDSTKTLIRICQVCRVPLEKYLVMYGLRLNKDDTPVRRAFPRIENSAQEDAIVKFADLLISNNLTTDNIASMLNTATAFAEFCDKKNKAAKQEE